MTTIVKVQQALFPAGASALVYGEGRSMVAQMELPKHVRKALGDDPKGYFEATRSNGQWVIGKRVEDQPW